MTHAETAVPPSDAPARDAGPGVEGGASWHRGWVKVAIALVVAGQSMTFGLAANITPPTGTAYWLLHGGLAASAAIVALLLAGPLVRECIQAVGAGRISVDLLFLVSLAGAFSVSVFGSLNRTPTVYYDLVAILLAIYTVGKMLGARSRARALQAIDELRAEHDWCVVVEDRGVEARRRSSDVRVGERVRIAPGEALGIDGRVLEGRGLVETTPLTGELQPELFVSGDTLYAGMRSVDGVFLVEVTAPGGDRRLDRVLGEIEDARLKPSRLQAEADRLAARFVPVVLFVSLATFAAWAWWASLGQGVMHGLAVLVVACPCALGLATPLGIWSGLVRLGRLGLVARSGDFLESLATADVALFDKTGTLFEPELRVTRFELQPDVRYSGAALYEAIALAEAGMEHPVAHALRAFATGKPRAEEPTFSLVESRIVAGRGIRARLKDHADGIEVELCAGSPTWMRELGLNFVGAAGRRDIEVALQGRPAARVRLDETPRERADEVFSELRRLGLEVGIVTGDAHFPDEIWPEVTRRTGVSPEGKAADIRARQATGRRIVYVGDGLNDAPALAAADVSIAIRQGADLARDSATAVLAGESLASMPAAVAIARAVRRAIRSNLWLAALYNTAGMAVAAAGWLHPIGAALLMAGSSVVVSTRVLRAAQKPALGIAPPTVSAIP